MNNKILTAVITIFLTVNNYSQILDSRFNNPSTMNNIIISVTIGGSFPVNGTFPALLNERVDEFLTRIYNEAIDIALRATSDPDVYRKSKDELRRFVLRGIRIKRSAGEEITLDRKSVV